MIEMDELREDVRATAPAPRIEFVADMDRRVEAGFAKEPRSARAARARRPRINLWGPGIALACTAMIAVVIAVGGGSSSDDSASRGGGAMTTEALPPAEDSGGGGTALAAPDSAAGAPREAAPSTSGHYLRGSDTGEGRPRVVEQRTSLELSAGADEFDEVTDDVLRVADDTGSIVQRSSVSQKGGKGFARYDLRVPASRLDDALADLSKIAHVTSRREATQDITAAYVSASDRLKDARDERHALLKALERADTDAEADAVRRQIRLARDRIVVAQAQVDALERRANRAKVAVTVRSTGKKAAGAWTPDDAVDDAGRILEVAAGVVVVTGAALVPVGVVALLALLGVRVTRRRRREAALDATA